jgi:hypothetical protein
MSEHPLAEVSYLGLLRRWVDFARFGDRKGSVRYSQISAARAAKVTLRPIAKNANPKDTQKSGPSRLVGVADVSRGIAETDQNGSKHLGFNRNHEWNGNWHYHLENTTILPAQL